MSHCLKVVDIFGIWYHSMKEDEPAKDLLGKRQSFGASQVFEEVQPACCESLSSQEMVGLGNERGRNGIFGFVAFYHLFG
jgi:hypothetical protein